MRIVSFYRTNLEYAEVETFKTDLKKTQCSHNWLAILLKSLTESDQ